MGSVRQLAELLALSPTTVSAALRGNPSVTPATRERVRQAAERIGYRPNPLASALMSEMRRSRNGVFRGILVLLHLDDAPDPRRQAIVAGATRRAPDDFRVVHFSVQSNHVHLVVEASDKRALAAGMRSVAIRIARYVNQLLTRRGRLWADRWHGRALTSPRAVRNTLVYVLANFRKHTNAAVPPGIDAFSSAVRFDGFRGFKSGGAVARAGPPFGAHHSTTPNSPLAAACVFRSTWALVPTTWAPIPT